MISAGIRAGSNPCGDYSGGRRCLLRSGSMILRVSACQQTVAWLVDALSECYVPMDRSFPYGRALGGANTKRFVGACRRPDGAISKHLLLVLPHRTDEPWRGVRTKLGAWRLKPLCLLGVCPCEVRARLREGSVCWCCPKCIPLAIVRSSVTRREPGERAAGAQVYLDLGPIDVRFLIYSLTLTHYSSSTQQPSTSINGLPHSFVSHIRA